MLAALDTDGKAFFALTHATTNSEVMMMFLSHLCRTLNQEEADWKDKTVLLLDNARYHSSQETRDYLRKMQVKVMFSGPYSYSTAPIELLFGGIKKGQLYPFDEPTGKK